MKMLFAWLHWLFNDETTPAEIMKHYAYKAGYEAQESGDLVAPYRPGTVAHEYWCIGFNDARDASLRLW